MQSNPFKVPEEGNEKVNCENYAQLNLDLWKDQHDGGCDIYETNHDYNYDYNNKLLRRIGRQSTGKVWYI